MSWYGDKTAIGRLSRFIGRLLLNCATNYKHVQVIPFLYATNAGLCLYFSGQCKRLLLNREI